MAHISITRATLADLPIMLRVMDESLDSPEDESEMPKRIVHWQDRIDSDRCIILVARYDNEIIGWARGTDQT
jgi:hypothetical protein